MKKCFVIIFSLFIFTGCGNANHKEDILNNADQGITYIMVFSSYYDNFNIKNIECIEQGDYMYYLFSYEGYYLMDVEFLNISAGDKLDSSTVCRYNTVTGTQDCLDGNDVNSNYSFSPVFQDIMLNKDEYAYYKFTETEIEVVLGK